MSPVFSEFDPQTLAAIGAAHTIPEILGQPNLWEAIWQKLHDERNLLSPFMKAALECPERGIILTGAGTSAFIGEVLQSAFSQRTGRYVRAIATTDIVTHPEEVLSPNVPTLLISFARSGNSPESVAAVERADAVLRDVHHLIITCNNDGDLAKYPTKNPRAVFTLPPEANDKGLAMTGSYTGMTLAGLLMSDLEHLEAARERVQYLASAGRRVFSEYGETLRIISKLDFRRAIFLGSGPLKGAARESHLKVQELTNGRVICTYDSPMGFRHGPKAAIDETTLIVFLVTSSEKVRLYENDLLNEINDGVRGLFRLGVGEDISPSLVDASISMGPIALTDDERGICNVLIAQILGVYRSLSLGLRPDSPSPKNTISRVVQGVTIHPFAPNKS